MEFHGPREQVFATTEVANGTAIIYTVPEGKILFLIESMLRTDAGANGDADVEFRTAADVHIQHLNFVQILDKTKEGVINADHFEPCYPIELSAGQDIVVVSSVALLVAHADIFGILVNA